MRISARLLEVLRTETRAAAPRECCGLLLRRNRNEICDIRPYSGPLFEHRFDISDEWLLREHYRARDLGLQVFGYYHSHPRTSGVPSATDCHGHPPGSVCVIIDGEGEVRAFQCDPLTSTFSEIRVEITEPP